MGELRGILTSDRVEGRAIVDREETEDDIGAWVGQGTPAIVVTEIPEGQNYRVAAQHDIGGVVIEHCWSVIYMRETEYMRA